jgi:hypothetical protein
LGRGDRIKGYSIAVEVFGRSESFDPQTDPIVRIGAGHLRRALERLDVRHSSRSLAARAGRPTSRSFTLTRRPSPRILSLGTTRTRAGPPSSREVGSACRLKEDSQVFRHRDKLGQGPDPQLLNDPLAVGFHCS